MAVELKAPRRKMLVFMIDGVRAASSDDLESTEESTLTVSGRPYLSWRKHGFANPISLSVTADLLPSCIDRLKTSPTPSPPGARTDEVNVRGHDALHPNHDSTPANFPTILIARRLQFAANVPTKT
jgi:hypothetical protein